MSKEKGIIAKIGKKRKRREKEMEFAKGPKPLQLAVERLVGAGIIRTDAEFIARNTATHIRAGQDRDGFWVPAYGDNLPDFGALAVFPGTAPGSKQAIEACEKSGRTLEQRDQSVARRLRRERENSPAPVAA